MAAKHHAQLPQPIFHEPIFSEDESTPSPTGFETKHPSDDATYDAPDYGAEDDPVANIIDGAVPAIPGQLEGLGLNLTVGRDGSISVTDRDDRDKPPRRRDPRDQPPDGPRDPLDRPSPQ